MTAPIGPAFPPIPGAADPGGRRVKGLMRPLSVSASGMSAYQRRLEIISQNIANAETTRTAAGGPYRRQVTVLSETGAGVEVTGVAEDPSEGRLVYDPGHPDANENGHVRYPNVDITLEIVDLMITRRIYEANASVFRAAKAMLRRAIDI